MSVRHLFSVVLLLAAVTAWAAPGLLGMSGLLLTPSADVLRFDDISAGFFSAGNLSTPLYYTNVGIRPNVEWGFARVPERETIVNVKYRVLPEVGDQPAVAVGVMDLTNQVNTCTYVVLSQQIQTRDMGSISQLRGTVGLAAGGPRHPTVHLGGLFFGISGDIGNRISGAVEYDTKNINVGASFAFNDEWRGHWAVISEHKTTILGASYTAEF